MIDGVDADEEPARLTELERQKLKTKWLQEKREDRAKLKDNEGERDE